MASVGSSSRSRPSSASSGSSEASGSSGSSADAAANVVKRVKVKKIVKRVVYLSKDYKAESPRVPQVKGVCSCWDSIKAARPALQHPHRQSGVIRAPSLARAIKGCGRHSRLCWTDVSPEDEAVQREVRRRRPPRTPLETLLSDQDRGARVGRGGCMVLGLEAAQALIQHYSSLIHTLRPHTPEPFIRRSALWAAVEHYDRSRADAARAIELDPNSAVGYYRLGYAHFRLQQFPEALQAFQKGLRVCPQCLELRHGFDSALCLLHQPSPAKAPQRIASLTQRLATAPPQTAPLKRPLTAPRSRPFPSLGDIGSTTRALLAAQLDAVSSPMAEAGQVMERPSTR